MKTMLFAGALCAAVFSFAAIADSTKKMARKAEPVFASPADLKWGEGPPSLPKGAMIVVLHGDPAKKAPFAIRFKMPDGYSVAPHWHGMDENITVLSGTLVMHMGDTMDAPAHAMEAGAYHFLPAKMHHAAEAKGETVIEIYGTGPLEIHYLNPADDPRKAAAAAK
jgi:quercetin dioxygenase-like cupin family protein